MALLIITIKEQQRRRRAKCAAFDCCGRDALLIKQDMNSPEREKPLCCLSLTFLFMKQHPFRFNWAMLRAESN